VVYVHADRAGLEFLRDSINELAGISPRRCLRLREMEVAGRFITSSSIAGKMSGEERWGFDHDSAAVHFRQLSAVGHELP
jgi:hypothetical protein